jgi:hypothetical protein
MDSPESEGTSLGPEAETSRPFFLVVRNGVAAQD